MWPVSWLQTNGETSQDPTQDIIRKVDAYKINKNEETRLRLQQAASDLFYELERPEEIKLRLVAQPFAQITIAIALEAGWLDLIAAASAPVTAEALAKATKSSADIVQRVMHGVVDSKIVKETAPYTYEATDKTRHVIQPGPRGYILMCVKILTPTSCTLSDTLKKNGYHTTKDLEDCAFHDHFGMTPWEKQKHEPELADIFNQMMRVHLDGRPHWLNGFDIKGCLSSLPHGGQLDMTDKSSVLMVDVGGGYGEDLSRFAARKAELELPGQLVLQDQPHVVAKSEQVIGSSNAKLIQITDHDLFKEQPVKGARAYYFRKVFHDWSDDKAVEILQNIKPAMDRNKSSVLILEIAMPSQEVPLYVVSADLLMLSQCSARQRTVAHWQTLSESAGLKLKGITPIMGGPESVIEMILP
ncbi:MAG: hypothetical protein Q9162_000550 [Coniocarpon cinnabarinum]